MSDTPSNDSPIRKLIVELGDRSYPIWIGSDVSEMRNQELDQAGEGALLIDQQLKDGFQLKSGFTIPVYPNGETAKSMKLLGEIYEHLATNGIGRDGFLAAVGGGVTGDLGGFAAASYLRGIDFYQIPTTLLAMVDSSVGGKTGINISAGKNLVGAFWQPQAVYISTQYLQTLPAWEFSAGMAEVIKYGMLYDPALYDQLTQLEKPLAWDHPALPDVIYRCCEIKAEIVKDDEKETAATGGRALLNLGHTFAHAIENVAGYGTYLHGEAVAIGLVLAARLSEELTKAGRPGFSITSEDVASVTDLIARYHLPTDLRSVLKRRSRVADYTWAKTAPASPPAATAEDCPPDAPP
ncbi:3-dehydroquinate synthase family protein, partial [Cerasicoccus arenae]